MDTNIVVGVDIGGSHITAALINLQTHTILQDSFVRRRLNSKGNCGEIIKEWTEAITHCKTSYPEPSPRLGIAMPGPFDYDKGISFIKDQDKYEALYGMNVKQLLAEALHISVADVFMMNDASCYLKGEVFGGAARGTSNVVGITLGTGLGSAICTNGMIKEGTLYCKPYKDGTAEDFLSTRWFVNAYKQQTGTEVKDVKMLRELVPEDGVAASLFREFGKNLGAVLAPFVREWNAELVVLGGNIVNAWDLFVPETETTLNDHGLQISIKKAKLGEQAAILGAGSLCMNMVAF